MADSDWEHWRKYLKDRSEEVGNCTIWRGTKHHRGGYGACQVKFIGDTEVKWGYAHRLAYMVTHCLTRADIKGKSVSHLCGNAACIKAEHLNLEPQCVNNARKICKNANKSCIGHFPYPQCKF